MASPKKGVKPVANKPVSKVKPGVASKMVKKAIPAKKGVNHNATSSKPATKNAKSTVHPVGAIKKSTPAKKAAKPEVKKAEHKNLNHPIKNTVTPAKKIEKPEPKPKAQEHITPSKAPVKPENTKITAKKPEVNPEPKPVESKSLPKAKDIKVPPPKPVVLPKITATKSRKYEPEFTKSVLDQPASEHKGPSMRYSDQELNEFRELIQRKLETAKKELAYLQGLITRKDEMGGDDTDNRYMTMEDGSLSMEREQLSQMASRQITFIDHLEKAMMRIENKTYGICRVTGKLIDKARLRAVPHATLSIEAKMGIVK